MPRDLGPQGATARTDERGAARRGNRRCEWCAEKKKKKKSRRNDVLSTTIRTNLRQIALEHDGGFFERNAAEVLQGWRQRSSAPAACVSHALPT